MNRFISFYAGELKGGEYHATEAAAFDACASREPNFGVGPGIVVCEVRQATLGDFVDSADVISGARERMAMLIGNDDGLSNVAPSEMLVLQDRLKGMCEQWAGEAGLRIDGDIVIKSRTYTREKGP